MVQIESFYQNQIQASFLDDGMMTRRPQSSYQNFGNENCQRFNPHTRIPKESTKMALSGKLGIG